MGGNNSQEVKEIFAEAALQKTGLFDTFNSKITVLEAINKNYRLVEWYHNKHLINLTPVALAYLIRKRNIKERTNPTPSKDISEFAWYEFEDSLRRYNETDNQY